MWKVEIIDNFTPTPHQLNLNYWLCGISIDSSNLQQHALHSYLHTCTSRRLSNICYSLHVCQLKILRQTFGINRAEYGELCKGVLPFEKGQTIQKTKIDKTFKLTNKTFWYRFPGMLSTTLVSSLGYLSSFMGFWPLLSKLMAFVVGFL